MRKIALCVDEKVLAEYADRVAQARKRIRKLSEASDAWIGSSEWHRAELYERYSVTATWG